MSTHIEVPLTQGLILQIRLGPPHHDAVSASLLSRPEELQTVFHVFAGADLSQVRVAEDVDGVWFGRTHFALAWPDLLKVADFLHLDIPQPKLPEGQEIPR